MSFADPVVVIGHRGAAGLAPENTLPGFREAYACGVNAVELDVYTVDGELVVIHDDTVNRTTNGTGTVIGRSLAGLRALDAGQGAQVPLLGEVVAELPRGVGLNVELKGPHTAAPTAAFIGRHPHVDWLVSSFDLGELGRFRALDPVTPVAPLFARLPRDPFSRAEALAAWGINLSRRAAKPRILAEARQRGWRILVYTVNALPEARALIEQGAVGVFTDYPDRISVAALTAG